MRHYHRYSRPANLSARFGVRAYIAPQPMRRIAEERTDDLVGAYVALGAQARHLHLLAQSAYMQGLHDVLEAIERGAAA